MNMRFLFTTCIASLFLFFAGCSPKQPKPYPPNIQKFKETFFADQKLAELVAGISQTETTNANDPWPILAKASENIESGQNEEAKAALRKVLNIPGLEARLYLWTWVALRSLGEKPNSDEADQPQGVVVEVPIEDGIDTIAAFADGSARYVNYAGKAIIWDLHDKQIDELVKSLVESAEPLVASSKFSTAQKPLSGGKERITILTYAGNRTIETKAGRMDSRVRGAALPLVLALIQKATESKTQEK